MVTSIRSRDAVVGRTQLPTTVSRDSLESPRALKILSAQPNSLAGMPQTERDLVIVTAVADEMGNEYPVSRIGDSVWYLTPERRIKNRKVSEYIISWPDDVPKSLVDDAKAALYCALRRGPQGRRWSVRSVWNVGMHVRTLLRYLVTLTVSNFSQVRALHLSDYISDLKKSIKPQSIKNRLALINLIWNLSPDVLYPLPEPPWGRQSLSRACGCGDDNDGPVGRTGKTPVIPLSIQRNLFAYCEARLDEADAFFRDRDAGKIKPGSYEITAIRDAALYLILITSGMRSSESASITRGCWRFETRNGVKFNWIGADEFKSRKGRVEFLVPPEALRAITILERYAEPLQARMADEAHWIGAQLKNGVGGDGLLANGMAVTDAVDRLNHIREIGQNLFLGMDKRRSDHLGSGSRVEVMSLQACNSQLRKLVRATGSDWKLANHQCRRTFAYNVANSRLGRMGLVFLKWQLKHASMSWTQLYASNPYQDHALYRELEEEQTSARVELMEGWMQPDAPLSGGAGRKLVQTRAMPVRNMKALLRHTAQTVEIRSTGHAWCLSGTRVCHGEGVYEPANCATCSQAVIDRDQASTWQVIHLENLRLAAITDCGPAVLEKARRAIRRSEEVLKDLCVPLPSGEQVEAYEKTGVIG